MPKYLFGQAWTQWSTIVVEANSEEEARRIAYFEEWDFDDGDVLHQAEHSIPLEEGDSEDRRNHDWQPLWSNLKESI